MIQLSHGSAHLGRVNLNAARPLTVSCYNFRKAACALTQMWVYMKEVFTLIFFILSISAFVLSIRSFKNKGFLFNNAYIYASNSERERMDKKPYYRQSAVVFLLIGIVFALIAVETLLETGWIVYIVLQILTAIIVYVIISSVLIKDKK